MISRIFNFQNEKTIFIISQGISAFVGILLGKFLAVHVNPEVFGEYNLQYGILSFLVTLFFQPIIQFFKKDYNFIFNNLSFRSLILFVFVLCLFSSVFVNIIFYSMGYEINFILGLVVLGYLVLYFFESLISGYLNINSSFHSLSRIIVVKSSSSLFFTLVLVFVFRLVLNESVFIWCIYLFGMLSSIMILFKTFKELNGFFGQINKIKKLFISFWCFGQPLIYLAIMTWVNNYLDRFVLDYFFAEKVVGVYSMNYGLGSKFFLLVVPLALGLITPIAYSNASINEKFDRMKNILFYYSLFSIILILFISFSGELLGQIFLSELYAEGFYLIPIVASSFFLLTFSYLFETVFYAEGKTKFILVSALFSSLINIILLYVLVPVFGILGAALSTFFGFASYLATTLILFFALKRNN